MGEARSLTPGAASGCSGWARAFDGTMVARVAERDLDESSCKPPSPSTTALSKRLRARAPRMRCTYTKGVLAPPSRVLNNTAPESSRKQCCATYRVQLL